jgi:hypothetical protein
MHVERFNIINEFSISSDQRELCLCLEMYLEMFVLICAQQII